MPTLHINGQLVAGITLGGQQVQKIQDGNGVTLYELDNGPSKWIEFTAGQTGSTIGMTHYGKNQSTNKPLIYVSTDDGSSWTEWDYSDLTMSNVGDKVRMYGDNVHGVSSGESNYSTFTMTGSIAASGDCTALLDSDGKTSLYWLNYCFYRLFYECTSLTTAPDLPSTTIYNTCYYEMFRGCTSLTSAPALPATTAPNSCYYGMFNGCTSLTSTPSLPATTLDSYCYRTMFNGCTSLTTTTTLPATTMANDCYEYMFSGCTALTTAPALPATTLASCCYQGMFYGCTALTTAPELPATGLTDNCYREMFRGCTRLVSAPALPATTLASFCYNGMFYGCTSLTSAPALPATILAPYCYSYMFKNCSNLTTVPDLSHVTTIDSSSCSYMYAGKSSSVKNKINTVYAPDVDTWTTSIFYYWLQYCASSGTIYATAQTAAVIPTGNKSGCPSGWTVTVLNS